MSRSFLFAVSGIVVVWGVYAALQRASVAAHFQPPPLSGCCYVIVSPEYKYKSEGTTQSIDTTYCAKGMEDFCGGEKRRGLRLQVSPTPTLGVNESATLDATLLYEDTLINRRLLQDSVGIRLLESQGAISVNPAESRFARVSKEMGPWQWVVTPQRAGSFTLLLEITRLPNSLDDLLHKPDTATLRRQRRELVQVDPHEPGGVLHRGTPLQVVVLTDAGWTAEQAVWMKIAGAILTLLLAALPIKEFVQRKGKQLPEVASKMLIKAWLQVARHLGVDPG